MGELDLLRGQVVLGVLREQVGQDEQAVQRGPQLVRHVGEELRLVLRRQRELLGLLLELLLGQLDLPVLALDLGVLPREEPGLLLELLVGLLQLLLLLLQELLGGLERVRLLLEPGVGLLELLLLVRQLLGQRLGALQELLGAHVGLDRVQDDADALGELVEEGEVDLAEAVGRRPAR